MAGKLPNGSMAPGGGNTNASWSHGGGANRPGHTSPLITDLDSRRSFYFTSPSRRMSRRGRNAAPSDPHSLFQLTRPLSVTESVLKKKTYNLNLVRPPAGRTYLSQSREVFVSHVSVNQTPSPPP